jgi:hypothetical protein
LSILSKDRNRKKTDKRKDPKEVLLFVISMISKVLLKAVFNAPLPLIAKNVKDSIGTNTYKLEVARPYDSSQLEHLRNFGAAFLSHSTVKKYAETVVPEGMTDKAAHAIKTFDIGTLTNQNNTQKVMEAITNADIDGFLGHMKSTLATVAASIHENSDVGDPGEQG